MPRPKILPKILAETPATPARLEGPQTDKQAAFVRYYAQSGISGAEAARLAGYADGKAMAYYLLAQPHIRQAVRASRETAIQGDLAKLALETLGQLMTSETTPAAVRHSCARTSLEMAGHLGSKGPESVQDKPLGEMTISELERFIATGTEKLEEVMSKAKVIPAKVISSE